MCSWHDSGNYNARAGFKITNCDLEAGEEINFSSRGWRIHCLACMRHPLGLEQPNARRGGDMAKQCRRHPRERFPDDFMFQLSLEEGKAVMLSRSQIATLKRGQNIKYRPYVFTEHGAVMLANVLRSPVAIRASIQVVRAFVNLRRMLASHDDLARKIDAIERRVGKHDVELQEVLRILGKLLEPPPVPPKRPLGFMPARTAGK